MFCPDCGKKIKDNAMFCPYCGRKISAAAKEAANAGAEKESKSVYAGRDAAESPELEKAQVIDKKTIKELMTTEEDPSRSDYTPKVDENSALAHAEVYDDDVDKQKIRMMNDKRPTEYTDKVTEGSALSKGVASSDANAIFVDEKHSGPSAYTDVSGLSANAVKEAKIQQQLDNMKNRNKNRAKGTSPASSLKTPTTGGGTSSDKSAYASSADRPAFNNIRKRPSAYGEASDYGDQRPEFKKSSDNSGKLGKQPDFKSRTAEKNAEKAAEKAAAKAAAKTAAEAAAISGAASASSVKDSSAANANAKAKAPDSSSKAGSREAASSGATVPTSSSNYTPGGRLSSPSTKSTAPVPPVYNQGSSSSSSNSSSNNGTFKKNDLSSLGKDPYASLFESDLSENRYVKVPKKSNSKKNLIALVIVAVLVLGVGVIINITGKKSVEARQNATTTAAPTTKATEASTKVADATTVVTSDDATDDATAPNTEPTDATTEATTETTTETTTANPLAGTTWYIFMTVEGGTITNKDALGAIGMDKYTITFNTDGTASLSTGAQASEGTYEITDGSKYSFVTAVATLEGTYSDAQVTLTSGDLQYIFHKEN